MLKIRLTRQGKKNKAFFRLVVAEHTSPIKGKFIEALGFLDPHSKESSLKSERIKYWMEKGAQCSDTAHNMLVKAGILKGPKRAVKIKKKEPASSADKGDMKPVSDESLAGKKEEAKAEKKAAPEKEEKVEESKTKKTVPEEAKQETANKEKK